MAEFGTIIKQVNRETYLDLSNSDLTQDNFIEDFKQFTRDKAKFLSGNTLSLILPDAFSEQDEKLKSVLEQIQNELNQRNISLKRAKKNANSAAEADSEEETESKIDKQAKVPEKKQEKNLAYEPVPQDLHQMLGRKNVLYLKSSLRAGQEIQHPGDVVVFGDVKHSAEIIASGDVIVWGKLRGIVHAGAEGDEKAFVAALSIEQGQIRISDKLVAISPDTSSKKTKDAKDFVPEIAKIVDNEVQILKFSQS